MLGDQLAKLLSLLLPALLLPCALAGAGFQCLDANGDPLDWFAMLKEPDGVQYAYVSSKSAQVWTQPSQPNLTRSGPLVATLNQVYNSAGAAADVIAAYNDEPPEPPQRLHERTNESELEPWSSVYGHMKGVVALTAGQSGFWLIHSVPKFPNLRQAAYSYPPTGVMYGQSFLCITVDSSAMADMIGKQLFTSRPDLYQIDVSPTAEAHWPSWVDLKNRKPIPAQLLNTTARLSTAGGLPVTHVAKSPHLIQDLYSSLLAGQLDSSLRVETWQHGSKLLNSTCDTRYNVTKVLRVRIGEGGLSDFPSTSDHSKWCVSAGSKPYVCIGDMNRAETQFHRGGGTACLQLPGLHQLFSAAVLQDQPCDQDSAALEVENQLMAMFTGIVIGILCAIPCTLAAVLVVLWLAVRKVAKANNGLRYQSL